MNEYIQFILTKNNIYELKKIVHNYYNNLLQNLKYISNKLEIYFSVEVDNQIYINEYNDIYNQLYIINEMFMLFENMMCDDQHLLLIYLKHTYELLHVINIINKYLWIQWITT